MIMLLKKAASRYFNRYRSYCPVCNQVDAGFNALPGYYSENALKYGYKYLGKGEMTALHSYSCSNCGASDRERLYADWIISQVEKKKLSNKSRIIHFAPEMALSIMLRSLDFGCYHTADMVMNECDFKLDMMNIPLRDKSYDFFICSHILEHVESDDKAISELNRITKDNGFGIIMAPIIVGLEKTIEQSSVEDEATRWRLYGQNDHVRLYAHNDYVNKIRCNGFHLEELGVKYFGRKKLTRLGLKETSTLYVARK